MKLQREDVESYLYWHAKQSEAKEYLERLRAALLPPLKEGLASPADLPFLVSLRTSERTQKDYKTPLLAALKRLLGTDEKAEKRLAKIESEFETITVDSLVVVSNKEYVKEEMAGAPHLKRA